MTPNITVRDAGDDVLEVEIDLGFLVGSDAGYLRYVGAEIPDDVPDCAVLEKSDDGGSLFTWVTATVELGGRDG